MFHSLHAAAAAATAVYALPPGWKAGKDQTGKEYYYNKELNISQWVHPTAADNQSTPTSTMPVENIISSADVSDISVSFTDTEGDTSTLRLDSATRQLSWHTGGHCYLQHISFLKFDAPKAAIIAPEHRALIARLVDPPAGLERDRLIRKIAGMARSANAVRLLGFPSEDVAFGAADTTYLSPQPASAHLVNSPTRTFFPPTPALAMSLS